MCTLTGEMIIPDTEQKLLSKPQDLDGHKRLFFLSETFFGRKMRFGVDCVFEKLDWGVLGAYGV